MVARPGGKRRCKATESSGPPTGRPASALRQRLGEEAQGGHAQTATPSTKAPSGGHTPPGGGTPARGTYRTNRPAAWRGEGAAGRRLPAGAGRHGDAWSLSVARTAMGPKRPKTGGAAAPAGGPVSNWEPALVSARLEEVKAAEGQGRGRSGAAGP